MKLNTNPKMINRGISLQLTLAKAKCNRCSFACASKRKISLKSSIMLQLLLLLSWLSMVNGIRLLNSLFFFCLLTLDIKFRFSDETANDLSTIDTIKCKGCRGCNPDEFQFAEIKDINSSINDGNPLPLVMPVMKPMHSPSNQNVLKPFGGMAGVMGQPNKTSDSTKNIFGGFNVNMGGLFTQTSFTESDVSDIPQSKKTLSFAVPLAEEPNPMFSLTPVFGAGNSISMPTTVKTTTPSQSSSSSTFSFEGTLANTLTGAPFFGPGDLSKSAPKSFSIFSGAQPAVTPVSLIFDGSKGLPHNRNH